MCWQRSWHIERKNDSNIYKYIHIFHLRRWIETTGATTKMKKKKKPGRPLGNKSEQDCSRPRGLRGPTVCAATCPWTRFWGRSRTQTFDRTTRRVEDISERVDDVSAWRRLPSYLLPTKLLVIATEYVEKSGEDCRRITQTCLVRSSRREEDWLREKKHVRI